MTLRFPALTIQKSHPQHRTLALLCMTLVTLSFFTGGCDDESAATQPQAVEANKEAAEAVEEEAAEAATPSEAAAVRAAAPDIKLELFEIKGGTMGYRGPDGEVVIPARYERAFEFNEHGIAAVWTEGSWALIDTNGVVVVKVESFDNGPDEFADGLARYLENSKVGYVDQAAKIIIKAQFEAARPFENGKAKVCVGCKEESDGEYTRHVGGQWWEIDREGKKLAKVTGP